MLTHDIIVQGLVLAQYQRLKLVGLTVLKNEKGEVSITYTFSKEGAELK